MSNTCNCLSLIECDIYLLNSYNANSNGIGYGYNYGSNYGASQISNPIDPIKLGRSIGAGKAKIDFDVVQVSSVKSKSINSSNCSGPYISGSTLSIETECWSDKNMATFLGAEITQNASSAVNKNIPAGIISEGDVIVETSNISNVMLINLATNLPLINGIDYLAYPTSINFQRDINATAGLSVSYNLAATKILSPFVNRNTNNYALHIDGVNYKDNKKLGLIFPKAKLSLKSFGIEPVGSDSLWNIPLSFELEDGIVAGASMPNKFFIYQGV
jgi:hypothetical protein